MGLFIIYNNNTELNAYANNNNKNIPSCFYLHGAFGSH